jgi:hypothetical protein
MILKGDNRSTRTKTRANDTFPKPQTRTPANKRMTYRNTLFIKLIAIYIYIYMAYIYGLSSYLAEDTVFPSERPMSE